MELDANAAAPTGARYVPLTQAPSDVDGDGQVDTTVEQRKVTPDGNCLYTSIHRWYFEFREAYPGNWDIMHNRLSSWVVKHTQVEPQNLIPNPDGTGLGTGDESMSPSELREVEKWRDIVAAWYEIRANFDRIYIPATAPGVGDIEHFTSMSDYYDWKNPYYDYMYDDDDMRGAMGVDLQRMGQKRANYRREDVPQLHAAWEKTQEAIEARNRLQEGTPQRVVADDEVRAFDQQRMKIAKEVAIQIGPWTEEQYQAYAVVSTRSVNVWATGFEPHAIAEILGIYIYDYLHHQNPWHRGQHSYTYGPNIAERVQLAQEHRSDGYLPRMNLLQSSNHFTYQKPGTKKTYDRAHVARVLVLNTVSNEADFAAILVGYENAPGAQNMGLGDEGSAPGTMEVPPMPLPPVRPPVNPHLEQPGAAMTPQQQKTYLDALNARRKAEAEAKARKQREAAAAAAAAAPPQQPVPRDPSIITDGVVRKGWQKDYFGQDDNDGDGDGGDGGDEEDEQCCVGKARVPNYDGNSEEAYNYTVAELSDDQIHFCTAKLQLAHESFIKHVANRKNYGKIMLMQGIGQGTDAGPGSNVPSVRQKQDNLQERAEVGRLWAEIKGTNPYLTDHLWRKWEKKYNAVIIQNASNKGPRDKSGISSYCGNFGGSHLKKFIAFLFNLQGLRSTDMADFWFKLCEWWLGFKGKLPQPTSGGRAKPAKQPTTELEKARKLRYALRDWYIKEHGDFRRLNCTVQNFWSFMETIVPLVQLWAQRRNLPYASRLRDVQQKDVVDAIKHLEAISKGTQDKSRERNWSTLQKYVGDANRLFEELTGTNVDAAELDNALKQAKALLTRIRPTWASAQELYEGFQALNKQIEAALTVWYNKQYTDSTGDTAVHKNDRLKNLLIIARFVRDRWRETNDKEKTDVYLALNKLVESTDGFLDGLRTEETMEIDTIRYLFKLYVAQRDAFVAFFGDDDDDGTKQAEVEAVAQERHKLYAPRVEAVRAAKEAMQQLEEADAQAAQAAAAAAAVNRAQATQAAEAAQADQAAKETAAAREAAAQKAEAAKRAAKRAEAEVAARVAEQQKANETLRIEQAAKEQREEENRQREADKRAWDAAEEHAQMAVQQARRQAALDAENGGLDEQAQERLRKRAADEAIAKRDEDTDERGLTNSMHEAEVLEGKLKQANAKGPEEYKSDVQNALAQLTNLRQKMLELRQRGMALRENAELMERPMQMLLQAIEKAKLVLTKSGTF